MLLPDVIPGQTVYHDIRNSFGRLLEGALRDYPVCVAHGPLYQDDPGERVLAPFMTSARQTGWKVDTEEQLAPRHVIAMAQYLRSEAARAAFSRVSNQRVAVDFFNEWTRAGLVLEVASRRGILVHGRGLLHVKWKLSGTVTGRFGAEVLHGRNPNGTTWSFNPLTIPREERQLLIPNGSLRRLASIDFKAMDLWSMLAIVPRLSEKYQGTDDPHGRTARIIFEKEPDGDERAIAKQEIFVHAYGGHSLLKDEFERKIPELGFLRALPHGEGARRVQRTSAIAFRAALSEALPLLVYDDLRPVIAVHDELVVDVSPLGSTGVEQVAAAFERGAQHRVGQPYRTSVKFGASYADCKA